MHVDRLVFPSVDHSATSVEWSWGRCRSSTFFGDMAEEQRPLPGVKSLFCSSCLRSIDAFMDSPVILPRACLGVRGHGQQFSALRIVTVVMTVIDKCGQAQKGAWWMSWHREATKDAAACDKLRGAGKRALIRRCLNGETRRSNPPSRPAECIGGHERTRGTETSQYPQEKKETSIPSVAASESGTSPNRSSDRGCGRLEGLQTRF
jgi:hypothetical protein